MSATQEAQSLLTQFASDQQRRFDSATSASDRKERGHFGTPPAIAEFMAAMFSDIPKESIRILDPGAGVGTLSAAVCQRVLGLNSPRHLEIELWETDPDLLPHLRKTMDRCRKSLAAAGHQLDYTVCLDDFILANTQKTLFKDGPAASFHLAILNPPYYKLRKDAPQARAMEHVVHGQPNIYAFFLAVAADLLNPGGDVGHPKSKCSRWGRSLLHEQKSGSDSFQGARWSRCLRTQT